MHHSLHPKNAVLAYVLTELLIPEAIVVKTDFLINESFNIPQVTFCNDGVKLGEEARMPSIWASVALRGLEKDSWTDSQKLRLPDGIRDEYIPFLILEYFDREYHPEHFEMNLFKCLMAKPVFFIKSHFYPIYEERNSIENEHIDFPLIERAIGIAPRIEEELIQKYNLVELSPGVMVMNIPIFKESIRVLNIESLPDEPHNASVKVLSLNREEREQASRTLEEWGVKEYRAT